MAGCLPLNILVAEDNIVNQKVAMAILLQLGYQTDLAVSGREVVAAVARQKYDLIFMDLQMPEMDGLEATRIICSQTSRPERPYIVALTANAMKEDRALVWRPGWTTISASQSVPKKLKPSSSALPRRVRSASSPSVLKRGKEFPGDFTRSATNSGVCAFWTLAG